MDHLPDLPDELIDDIYSAGLGEQDWEIALQKLRLHTDTCLVTLLSYDENTQLAAVNKAVGESPDFVQICLKQYADDFYLYDPGAPIIGDWPVGRWYEDSKMLSLQQRGKSIFHNEFLRPNNMGSISGLFVHRGSEGSTFLSFLGAEGSNGFSEAQRIQISSLSQHISRALRTQVRMQYLQKKESLTESVLNALSLPIFVLDEHRRLHLANNSAHQLIKSEPALRFSTGKFSPADCTDDLRWKEACQRGVLILNTLDGERLILSLTPIPIQSALMRGISTKLTLMTAMRKRLQHTSVKALQLAFGVTSAEVELSILMAYEGLSPQECAERRGVSINTIRTQIQALLAKTGVSGISQLISLVLRLG
nr:response regulator transcription factor [Herbaspirillum sp. ASV7]